MANPFQQIVNSKLIQSVSKLFRARTPAILSSEKTTTTGQITSINPAMLPIALRLLSQERKTLLTEVNRMVLENSLIDESIQIKASDIVSGFFTVQIPEENAKAKEIIDQTIINCQLKQKAQGWMRKMITEGDLWVEIETDGTKIIRTTKLEALITKVRVDENGRTITNGGKIDPANCYYQEDDMTGQEVKSFAQWQIVHWKWDEIDGDLYGNPQYGSVRLDHKRFQSLSEDLVIRRKLGSGDTYIHSVGTSENPGLPEAVEKYKQDNKDTLSNPFTAIKNYFTNGLVDIKKLEGDINIDKIDDLKLIQSKILCATGIAEGRLSGFQKGINRDILVDSIRDDKEQAQQICEIISEGYKQIFDFALLLQGIDPEAVDYKIVWKEKVKEDQDKLVERELKKYEKKTQSLYRTMQNLGIEDPQEEIERMIQETIDYPQLQIQQQSFGLGSFGERKVLNRDKHSQMEFVLGMNELRERLKKLCNNKN